MMDTDTADILRNSWDLEVNPLIKEENDKIDKITYPSQLNFLMKNNNDYKIDELVSNFIKFKKEEQDMINNNKPIPHYKFRKTIFKQIELLLCQIGEINDKQKRKEHIEDIYRWYKNKMNFYFTLCRMNKKTYLDEDEKKYINDKIINNKDSQKEDDIDKDDKHRTYIPYKKVYKYINEFQNHRINKKRINNINKSAKNIHNISILRNNRIINNLYQNRDLTKHYTKKIKTRNSKINNLNNNIPKYEIKSSYSIERPKYDIPSLEVEKKINMLKNKYISEKRSQAEIKTIIEDFGKKRALYKSNLNKKQELKSLIKQYKLSQSAPSIKKINKVSTNVTKKESKDSKNLEKEANNVDVGNIDEKQKRRINKIVLNKVKNISNDNLLITSLNYCNNNGGNNNNKILNKNNNIKENIFITNKEENKEKEKENIDNIIQNEEEKKEEKILNINCEFPKLKSSMTLLSLKKDESDSIMKNISINPILMAKKHNLNLCSIKDKNILKYENNDNNYSLSNMRNISTENINDIKDISNASNIYEYTKKKLSSSIDNNFLHIKKKFDVLKKNECINLKNVIKSKNHSNTLNKSALFYAFTNPIINLKYPCYFLPRYNGNNLLEKPYLK